MLSLIVSYVGDFVAKRIINSRKMLKKLQHSDSLCRKHLIVRKLSDVPQVFLRVISGLLEDLSKSKKSNRSH